MALNRDRNYVLTHLVKRLPNVISNDHPLSQGQQVKLVTNSRFFPELKLSDKDFREYTGEMGYAEACHNVYYSHKITTITIEGANQTKVRIIELIVHEVSHMIDEWFDRCVLKNVDTELRAYYLDWAVGKILHHMEL